MDFILLEIRSYVKSIWGSIRLYLFHLKSVEGLTYDMAMNYEIKIIGLVDTLESKLDSKQIQEIPGIVQDKIM